MPPPLTLYVVYAAPADFPLHYIVRKFEGDRPTPEHWIAGSLHAVRDRLPPGLSRLCRDPHDDPNIVEVWL